MSDSTDRAKRIESLNVGLLSVFLLLALSLFYWSVVRAPVLAQRADNPRRVEAELRIRRGRILDINGVMLAETVGTRDNPERVYPIANVGPAVGYYSFRHGTSGVEEGYDSVLRGDSSDVWEAFWRQNLHHAQVGRDIRVTLNADWQRAADALLGEQHGAIILLTLPEGSIRAMASHPSYDPNYLDEQFEELVADENAPLLNRATQGQYQPGMVMQPFVLAALVDAGLLTMTDSVENVDRTVTVHDQLRRCRSDPPVDATWSDALQHACPNPMLTLAERLTESDLSQTYERFGLLTEPDVPLATAAPALGSIDELKEALLGQDTLTVTPLQVAIAWSALANDGQMPPVQLVSAVEDETGVWNTIAPEPDGEDRRAVSSVAAQAILSALPRHDGVIAEHATMVLSGPEGNTNSWYMGLAPAGAPHYAVVVVIEDAERVFTAQQIGRALLNVVLAPE